MGRRLDYRSRADECVRLAQAANPQHRSLLLEIAEAWFMLAELELDEDKNVPIERGTHLHS